MQFLASYAIHLAPNASPPSPRKHPTEGRCKYVFVCTKTLLALTPKDMKVTENSVTTFPSCFALFQMDIRPSNGVSDQTQFTGAFGLSQILRFSKRQRK